jgi:hypothetical protein
MRTVAARVVLARGRRPVVGRVGEQRAAVRAQRSPLLAPLHVVRDARVQELHTTYHGSHNYANIEI